MRLLCYIVFFFSGYWLIYELLTSFSSICGPPCLAAYILNEVRRVFSQPLLTNIEIAIKIRSWSFPSKLLPIHSSVIIIKFINI
jgi:hypothetical protein